MLLQKSWMPEPAYEASIVGEGVADVRGSKAVAYTGVFCVWLPVSSLHGAYPFRHCLVGEGGVLPFPGIVVKPRV